MVEHVAEIIDVLLKAFLHVVFRALSRTVLEEGIVPFVRLEGFRETRDARRKASGLCAQVHADALQRLLQLPALSLRLEVRRVPLDKADRLVSVRDEEVVDGLVELVVQRPIRFDCVLDLGLVHVGSCQVLLRLQPVGIPPRKVSRFLVVQAELLRHVGHFAAGLQVLRRVNELFFHVRSRDQLRDGLALDHKLRQCALFLRQRGLLAVLILEPPHLVVHTIDETLAFLLVDVDRLEDRLVDLLALFPAEDGSHATLRRAVVQCEAALRAEQGFFILLLEGVVPRILEQLRRLRTQVLTDVLPLHGDRVGLHGLLGRVVVRKLHHL